MIRQFARWYRTPAGIVSLACIGLVLVFAALGLVTAALLVTLAWVGVIVPHKLMRERRDWELAVHQLTAAQQQQSHELRSEIESLSKQLRRMNASLSAVPTGEEVRTWQDSVETSQAEFNGGYEEQLGALDERQVNAFFHLASLEDRVQTLHESAVSSDQRSKISEEIQAMSSLYALLAPHTPLPPINAEGLSPNAALELCRVITEQEPSTVVVVGNTSSTVIAALAAAKNGFGHVISLEHDIGYARNTRKALEERGLDKVAKVVEAPIVDFRIEGNEQRWYELPEGLFETPIEVLYLGHRDDDDVSKKPALALLYDDLTSKSVVLLGSTDQSSDTALLAEWHDGYGLMQESVTSDEQLRRLRFRES